jgi:hypothetical protein
MMTFLSYWLQSELAGIWPLVAAYGIGGVIVAALLVAAWFSPIFKQQFLWAAAAIAVGMAIFSVGVTKGERRVQARWDAEKAQTVEAASKARADAERAVARKPSRWLPNRADRYDRDGK